MTRYFIGTKAAPLVLVSLCLFCRQAAAHNELLSQARLWQEEDNWILEVSIDGTVAEAFYWGKTEDPTYRMSMENIGPAMEIYEKRAPGLMELKSHGKVLAPEQSKVLLQGNHVVFRILYPYNGEEELVLTHQYLDDLQRGHHTLVEVQFPEQDIGMPALFSKDVRSIRFRPDRQPEPSKD